MTASRKPRRKVVGATLAAALGAIITIVLDATGAHITPGEASAISTLAAALGGYLTPEPT